MICTTPTPRILLPLLLLVLMLAGPLGCNKAYYSFWEKFGYEKRDLLVSSVKDARDAQVDAKEQFASALEEFQSVVGVEPGEAAKAYRDVDAEFARSMKRAEAVRAEIDDVESVGSALFDEWSREIEEYTDAGNRRTSQGLWDQSHERYQQMLSAMHRAEAKMEPVLAKFEDQRLLLKHIANAEAVASLEDKVIEIEGDIRELIEEMQAAIDEANSFIDSMPS